MIGEIEFYTELSKNYQKEFNPGQFFYAPIPFFSSKTIEVLKLDYFDSQNTKNCNFVLDSYDPSQIQTIPPIQEINIHNGEMIVCMRHKIRPVIAISKMVPYYLYAENKDEGMCQLVAPLYSTRDKGGNYKFDEKFLKKIQAYSYPNLFLLPEDNTYGVKESIIRLDRVVFVPTTYLKHCPTMLNEKAILFLTKWFHYLTLGQLDETILLYRNLLLEQYPDLANA